MTAPTKEGICSVINSLVQQTEDRQAINYLCSIQATPVATILDAIAVAYGGIELFMGKLQPNLVTCGFYCPIFHDYIPNSYFVTFCEDYYIC